jgi:hypothetical protein
MRVIFRRALSEALAVSFLRDIPKRPSLSRHLRSRRIVPRVRALFLERCRQRANGAWRIFQPHAARVPQFRLAIQLK